MRLSTFWRYYHNQDRREIGHVEVHKHNPNGGLLSLELHQHKVDGIPMGEQVQLHGFTPDELLRIAGEIGTAALEHGAVETDRIVTTG